MNPVERDPDGTIVAISTPSGRAAIGVVRVSGPAARRIVERFFRSRTAYMDRLARTGVFATAEEPIDRVVLTFFEAPRSYTGEDVAEISAHGNPRTLDRIVDLLVSTGARRAEPGEFTLRAVSNGKLDLAQAEAVRDFIAAQTERQARTAMLQLDGALSRKVRPIREALIALVAEIEAAIDFADDDVPPVSGRVLAERTDALGARIKAISTTFRAGRVLSEGVRLAIAGKPNAGKSSLFNALAEANRAIVTPVAGTTRDVLSEPVDIEGIPVKLMDTAGIRETCDAVESIGIERARETLAEADLVLVVLDLSRAWDSDDDRLLETLAGRPHLVLLNKCDLPAAWNAGRFPEAPLVSATEGRGIDGLRSRIVDLLGMKRPSETEDFVVTSRRQYEGLEEASRSLFHAAAALLEDTPHEMVVLDLYAALSSVGQVSGEVTTEDILDRVFSTFCIGK